MKTKIKKSERYKAIKALLENLVNGLQAIPDSKKNIKILSLKVEDHEDYMMRVSALIEVCVIALDGKGSFCSKALSHISTEASVSLVLEMVIQLLPFDQMFCLDRIAEIIHSDFNNPIERGNNQSKI